MNKIDLKKLTKSKLIKLLLNQEAKKQIANEFENSIVSPPKQEESLPRNSINNYESPEQFRDRQKKQRHPKPTRKPPLPPPPKDPFNFDDDIFQTENTSLGKFKIIGVQSRQNKKFKSYMNEFTIKILKKLDDIKVHTTPTTKFRPETPYRVKTLHAKYFQNRNCGFAII